MRRFFWIRVTPAALIVVAGPGLAGAAQPAMENFDAMKPGAPVGWTATKTGSGTPRWTIETEATAPSAPQVLKQSGVADFPVCIKEGTALKDGFVEVKFKPVAGKEDRAGGVIWRALDADNYYVARANALEDNVTVYHTVRGRRVAFKSVDLKVTSGAWHTLRVEFKGDRFTVIFDGKQALAANDATFAEAGKVGVWTKADSVTLFDDFRCGE